MSSRLLVASRGLVALVPLMFAAGCNNALNPFCGSARPAPLIGSLSPSQVSFSQVQQGVLVTVNGNDFVQSSEIVVNGKALGPKVISGQVLQVTLNTDVISGPGSVQVKVMTPSGNVGDAGCSSGGTSSALTLTVSQ
jgi:hypothetical protein